jgi:hypothetical protein
MPIAHFPDDTRTIVSDIDIASLRASLGAGDDALAEALAERIHDIGEHFGALSANQTDDEDEQDQRIGWASCAASDVVNEGVESMLAWLIAFHGRPAVYDVLADIRTT